MKKYRLKIYINNDGSKTYEPQIKDFWGWSHIGNTFYNSRSEAIAYIQKEMGSFIKKIEYENLSYG